MSHTLMSVYAPVVCSLLRCEVRVLVGVDIMLRHPVRSWELTRYYPFGGCPLSVPKLSAVLFQIRLVRICRLTEVVGDVVVADQFTASAVVDVVGVLIVVADELKQVSPLAESVDEDLITSCDLHAYHLRYLT